MSTGRVRRFIEEYSFQTRLIQQLVDDISDEESLLQLPFEANCPNWILGHILTRRHSALEAIEAGPFWKESQLERYRTGSEPITGAGRAMPFKMLLNELERSMVSIQNRLDSVDDATLDQIVVNDRGEKSARDHLEGFLWHETYHIGQLDLLRAYVLSMREA